MNAMVNTSITNRLRDQIDSKSKSDGPGRRRTPVDKISVSLLIVIIALLAAGAIYYYNSFVYLTDDVETSLAQINVHIQKRKNLIINLEKTVIDYSTHERELFTVLAELRRDMRRIMPGQIPNGIKGNISPIQPPAGLGKNTADWNEKLSVLIAVAEKFPDLKLNDNFMVLMNTIIESENKIAESRMKYNNCLKELINATGEFPGNFYAAIFQHRFNDFEHSYFKLNEDEQNFLKVNY